MMRLYSIGDVCNVVSSGGTPSRKQAEYFTTAHSGHLWVKSKELLDSAISTTEERITDEGLNNSSAKYYPERTVLVAMYGANVGQLGWLRKPATVNQAVCGLVVNPAIADFRFVFYTLFHTRSELAAKAQGAAQQNLNQDLIRSFPISLPELRVQQAVASILSAYDDLIENNTRRIKILEEMAHMIYREWFVAFRFPGHEKVGMVESELGPIPEGWNGAKLGDVLTLEYGKALKEADRLGGSVSVYGSSGIVGHHNEKLTSGPGIIVGRKGNVGSVFYYHSDLWVIDTAYYVRSDLSLYFLYFNLLTQNFLNNDAAVPGLNRNQAYSLPVVVPDHNTLAEFERIVAPMFALKRCLEARNTNLRTTRDMLLPKLISGEIPVEAAAEVMEQTA